MSLSDLLSTFELIDWIDDSATGAEDNTGTPGVCVVKFGPVELNQLWAVERVVVDTNSTSASAASIYKRGNMSAADLADYTAAGNADVADLNTPVRVPGGESLAVKWTGLSAGAICTANVQIAVLARRG